MLRTWLSTGLAMGTTLAVCAYYAYAHGRLADSVGGLFGPRFLVADHGAYLMWILLAGVVFLAFDFRARDRREHFAETRKWCSTERLRSSAGTR